MILYIDCETTGLSPHHDRVTLFQYKIDDSDTKLIQNPELTDVHALLDTADIIVGHNLSFDLAFLKYDVRSIDRFDDTLYLDRIVNFKEDYHSLDNVSQRILGYDVYENFDKKVMQKSDWAAAELSDAQIEYASLDVDVLPTLYHSLKSKLSKNVQAVYDFDKKSILAGLLVQQHGLPVLRDDVYDEASRVESEAHRLIQSISPLNANSPKQVCEALGVESSNAIMLAELTANGVELAKKVRDIRSLRKNLNELKKLKEYDRFYGTLFPAADTGRFRSKNENLQNINREYKKFIGTRDNVILSADFAQLELRTIAAITGDSVMCELFKNGEDLHNYAAAALFGPDFTKQDRQIAKVFNFQALYGAGANTMQSILLMQTGVKIPIDEIKRHRNKWLSAFGGVAAWQRQRGAVFDFKKTSRTPHGRPYLAAGYSQFLNIENQGAGAEVARIALHYIQQNLPFGAWLVNFVHDSYLVECVDDEEVYKKAARVMHDGMTYAWEKAPLDRRGIEMPVDVGVARNWKDADALENCIYIYSGEDL